MSSAARSKSILGWALFLLVACALTWRTAGLASPPDVVDEGRWALQDFRDAVHQPARAWLDGGNPYDAPTYRAESVTGQDFPLYTPGHLALHAPFALVPLGHARWAWFAMGLVLAVALARVSLGISGTRCGVGVVGLAAAALLASRPGHMNQVVGNLAWEIVLASVLALELARRRPRLAGLCLAIAAGKPTFGAPLGLLMLCRGDRRAVGWGLAWSALLVGGGLAWMALRGPGLESVLDSIIEFHLSSESRVGVKPVSASWARLDLLALLQYARGAEPGRTARALCFAGPLVLAGAVLAWRRPSQAASSALIALTVLITIYHQAYDGVFLFPFAIAAARGALPVGGPLRAALGVALALPLVNYAATATVLARVEPGGAAWRWITSLNPAALFLAWTLLLLQVARGAAAPARPCGGSSSPRGDRSPGPSPA